MIGKICIKQNMGLGRFRYYLNPSGSSTKSRCESTCDSYKIGDLVIYEPVLDGRNFLIILNLAEEKDKWDAPKDAVKAAKIPEIDAVKVEKVTRVRRRNIAEIKSVEVEIKKEEQECKSPAEINQLFAESVREGKYSIALHWLSLGADVDFSVNKRGDTLLLQSVIANKLIATGFLLAIGAHPLTENSERVFASGLASRSDLNIDKAIKSLLTEGCVLCESERRTPKIYQQLPDEGRQDKTTLPEINAPMQNQDSSPENSTSIGDAQFLQDMRSDMNDASRDWGYRARDHNSFGGYPGMDDHGDESFP